MGSVDLDGGGSVRALSDWDEARVARLGTALVAAGNSARIGLVVVRREIPEARIVYVSDAGASIMGHPRASIVDRPARSFLTPDEQQTYKPASDVDLRSPVRSQAFETSVVTEDGRTVRCEVTMAPIEFEGEPLLVIFFQDVSERRRATEALRQSEERFRALVEHAPDAVWVNDGERLLYVNSASVRMLGYDSIDELLGKSAFDIIHPSEHDALRGRIAAIITGDTALPPKEYRTVRKDGTVFTTEVQTLAVEWQDRKVILGFARDVTARKELEAKLGQADRLAALGTLLAGIAHEMNNPLAYVLLGIEKARTELGRASANFPGGDAVREILRNVQLGADRVAGIVRQLRATSRPEVPHETVVDLEDVLAAALRVAGNEIRHRAELVTSFDHGVPTIEGDPQRLEQVFLNLLVNATHALPEGRPGNEIHVSLYTEPGTGPRPEPVAIVEVEDNGVGIAPDILPRIFDPFFTTKPVGVGTGLGLSICHSIVTSHRGSIEVDSVAGVRTTFRVRLPLGTGGAGARVAAPAASPQIEGPARGGGARAELPSRAAEAHRKRVLIVDDEPSLADLIQRLLQETCRPEVVPSGRRALERIAEVAAGGGAGADSFDVILCDLMMPGMTGMELYGAVARQWPGLERRFVFMTGGAFTTTASDFLALVRARCIDKPFDVATLREAVEV
jgi:PAS domain S-box-containing protein